MIYEPLLEVELPEPELVATQLFIETECANRAMRIKQISLASGLDIDFRKKCELFLNTFVSFVDGKVVVNKKRCRLLAETLYKNISVITEEDMKETAERALEDLREGSVVYFYLHQHQKRDSSKDFDNSNEYMLALVKRLAQKRGIVIKTIAQSAFDTDLDSVKEVRYIDDVSYSGSQLIDQIVELSTGLPNMERVKVYLSASTEYSQLRMKESFKKLTTSVEVVSQSEIPGLGEILSDEPGMLSYFEANLIMEVIYDAVVVEPSVNEDIWECLNQYLGSLTLTRTAFKIPDGTSFPYEIGGAFENTFKNGMYRL